MTPKAEKIIKLWNEGKSYIEIQKEAETTAKTISAVKKKYPELITRENVITAKPFKTEVNPQKSPQSQSISGSKINRVIPLNSNTENLNDNSIVKDENVKLLIENENLRTEIKEALEANEKKDKEIRQLKTQLIEANSKNQKYDKLLKNFENLGKENGNLKAEIVRQNKYIKNICTENDNLWNNIKKYKEEINTLKSQLKKANDNFENQKLKTAIIEAGYLKAKLEEEFNS